MFEKLGRFEIKGVLGRGAMGEVYLGIDPAIGREVAIKTILATAAQAEEAKQRFSREAKAAGVLNHPNIVTIYEFGEDQGVLFIAMERVRGQDLEEMLRQRSLTAGEALEVLAQVCDGLEFAHRNHVIHRDIKPSNVRVLRDGRRIHAKVMDFGVARLKDSEMTATGTVVGTVSYMAPEYIRTGRPDGRSDLFAVGVMLYECISGRRPFEGDTTPTILYKIVNEPPDPVDLSQLRDISPAIRSVLDRALAKDPDQRYQTADEFAHALRAAKDPTWQGQVREATQRMENRTAALPPALPRPTEPTLPARVPAAPTAAVQVRKPASGSNMALVAALVGFVGLAVLAAGGFFLYQWMGARRVASAASSSSAPAALASTPAAPASTPTAPASTPAAPAPSPAAAPTAPEPAAATAPAKAAAPAPPVVPFPPHPAPEKLPPPVVTPVPEPASRPAPPPVQPTAAKAAPEPSTAAGTSQTEQRNTANVSLSDAIRLADSDPARSIEGLRRAIAADPANANAYAWLVVVLYEQGRYQEIPAVLGKARQNGIPRARLMNNVRFKMAMQNDKLNRKIPGGTGGDE
jgi:serine/threonine-protein kinase